jgi:hypothetical protein
MTPEEQRVAIAEACGWEHCLATQQSPVEKGGFKLPNYFGKPCEAWTHPKMPGVYAKPPDYLSDLNAAHFGDQLDKREQDIFAVHLAKIVCNEENRIERGVKIDCTTAILFATAAQRCEAFLKVRGLWK